MPRLLLFIPLGLFFILAIFLWKGLSIDPRELPSALLDKPFPEFTLSALEAPGRTLTTKDFVGRPVLVNVWATWCPTCKYEHPYLLELATDPQLNSQVTLYGVNYKDERPAAQEWLTYYKDPYQFSIFDEEGTLGLDLGVYGAPETFVIDHHGIIRKRFAGALDIRVWRKEFEPLIKQLINEKLQGK